MHGNRLETMNSQNPFERADRLAAQISKAEKIVVGQIPERCSR